MGDLPLVASNAIAWGAAGTERFLGIFPKWAATLGKMQLAGRLASPAVGADVIWALSQPWSDDEISRCWNAWLTAYNRMYNIRFHEWTDKVKAIQAAWPNGADRRAFDRFIGEVWDELIEVENSHKMIADTIQGTQNRIHDIVDTALLTSTALLTVLIASEFAEAAFPGSMIGTMMKNAAGALMKGAAAVGIGAIVVEVMRSLSDVAELAATDAKFPIPQLNRYGGDSFRDITIDNVAAARRGDPIGWAYY